MIFFTDVLNIRIKFKNTNKTTFQIISTTFCFEGKKKMFISYEDGLKSSWANYKNFSPSTDTNKRKLELMENFMMADTLKTFYDKQDIRNVLSANQQI